jgi:8-oxo-dGTP pyrophosphatase MutT (NUDIX family)
MLTTSQYKQKSKERPWRQRAEIYVIKNGNLIVGIPDKGWTGYIIPGGGIDKGETPKMAAKRETLEELGVSVKNLKSIGTKKIKYYQRPNMSDYQRNMVNQYSGAIFHSYTAQFHKIDKSKWGAEADSYNTTEVSIPDAIKFFKKHASNTRRQGDKYNYEKAMYVLEILKKIKRA